MNQSSINKLNDVLLSLINIIEEKEYTLEEILEETIDDEILVYTSSAGGKIPNKKYVDSKEYYPISDIEFSNE